MDFPSFDAFEKLLYELTDVRYNTKEDAPLISPATYVKGEKRRNVNVIDWGGWCALDVDTFIPEGNLEDEFRERFSGYRFVAYSTASSRVEHPKFRVVFPTTRRVQSEDIRPFWHALVTLSDLPVDPQCKDLSRMYYVPATYRDAHNFIFSQRDGAFLDPDVLMEKYPAPKPRSVSFFDNLPEEVQQQIIEHRKQQMDNTTISWTAYRNCPFWPKSLAAEYMNIVESGWYHKFYQIMVAVASNAIREKYPITANEIAQMCFEFDAETGGWYKDRDFETEANRAIEFVYRSGA